MLNQVLLVGRVATPVSKNTEDKEPYSVPLDMDGKWIRVHMSETLGEASVAHLSVGTVIGIKGRLEMRSVNDGCDGHKMIVVAEKVSFIQP